MSELTEFLHRFDPAILSASIAVSGVFLSVFVSALVSRRTNYLNVVTAERSKWIEKLRGNLAKYSATAHAVFYKAKHEDYSPGGKTSAEYYTLLKELQDIRSLLKLQLNPRGEIDRNIIVLIDQIYDLSRTWTFAFQLAQAERLLVLHAQWLLKAEWEKVKSEARGPLRKIGSKYSEWRYGRKYRAFFRDEGAILPVKIV